MIIGTPTAFCVSLKATNNMLLIDNMEVATALKFTTDILPTIVIGDLIDPVKANKKAADWRSNNTTANFTIIVDGVDRNGFSYYVTNFATQHIISKVILMTSGVWSCCPETSKKYGGLDFNFKTPSEYLTSKFRNLHILAMVGNGPTDQFSIHHLHDGETKVY